MGTRADFYIGMDENAEWLGSVGYDGYPAGIDPKVFKAKTKRQYINAVKRFLTESGSGTLPEQGWPWPWNDSGTSDYAYAWDEKKKKVMVSSGSKYITIPAFKKLQNESRKSAPQVFPNMKERQNVAIGPRSGMFLITRNGIIG